VSAPIRGFRVTRGFPARKGVRKPSDDEPGDPIARLDTWADDVLERLRGNPVADTVFTSASRLGEFSLIWHVANVARGLTGGGRAPPGPGRAARRGGESLLVNQGLKRLFRRARPTVAGDPRYPVRRPLTSSFPSGHASAAGFNAVLLTGWDGPRAAPLWWGLALIVGTSRAYVRIHHPSDVVAGLATGALLGIAARQLIRRLEIG
jgi:membrane-associated phospholipid phosphatase